MGREAIGAGTREKSSGEAKALQKKKNSKKVIIPFLELPLSERHKSNKNRGCAAVYRNTLKTN